MSLHPQSTWNVPEATARVARAAFPKGNPYMSMYDEMGALYRDEMFLSLFPRRGRPSTSPARLALILVMQFTENLTDRQAADAVRSRIDWKYALGLDLADPGFDFSVLSEFRDRLLAGEAEQLVLDAMLARFQERGLLKTRGRQRTDSTHILAAVRSLNRLELVGRTLQHTLNILAEQVPQWIQTNVPPAWFDRYRRLIDEYRLPQQPDERRQLAETFGRDGVELLRAIDQDEDLAEVRCLPAIEILRQVWNQQYQIEDDQVQWREVKELSPSAERIASPHDLDARYSTKRSVTWVGYKAHLSETCDDDYPCLITHVETTPATEDDGKALPHIHQELQARDRLPREHFADTAYGSAEMLAQSQIDFGVDLICPVRCDVSWQVLDAQAFDLAQFHIDWEAQQVTCPQGHLSEHWIPAKGPRGRPTIEVQFHKEACRACPERTRCTRSKDSPRGLTLHVRQEHEALQQARQRQETTEFKRAYGRRAGIEGAISQATVSREMRRSRYVGLKKTHLQHVLTAASMNLTRLIAWWQGIPKAQTRRSPFAALAPT
jgi:transposase